MGGNMSRVVGCFAPHDQHDKVAVYLSEPFDEGLGHSFCYVRPISAPSPPHCNSGFDSSTGSYMLKTNLDNATCSHEPHRVRATAETSFKTISGASVSANTSTPRTITSREQFSSFANVSYDRAAAFEATSSFTSIPLQPVPRGLSQSGPITIGSQPSGPLDRGFLSGPIERGFLSGPLERGFLSGPLERGCVSGPMEAMDRSLFSAPLTSSHYAAYLRRRRRSLAHLVRNLGHPVKKALSRSLSKTTMQLVKTQKSLTAPVKLLWGMSKYSTRDGSSQCDCPLDSGYASSSSDSRVGHNLQWAQGKAGEDRVHVVLSEEHGWLFVGIYDGFSGPDAPDFLMSNLYKEVYKELRGLLWDTKEAPVNDERDCNHVDGPPPGPCNACEVQTEVSVPAESISDAENLHAVCAGHSFTAHACMEGTTAEMLQKDVWDSQVDVCRLGHLGEGDNSSMGVEPVVLDIPHSEDRLCTGIVMSENPSTSQQSSHIPPPKGKKIWFGRSLSELKLRKSRYPKKDQKKVPNADVEQDEKGTDNYKGDNIKETKSSIPDHPAILNALASALISTEKAFFQMADYSMREMPELALMGSCVLVMLMKGADVYVMNVGDSRAILAQLKNEPRIASVSAGSQVYDTEKIGARDTQLRQELERIMEETPSELETFEAAHACSSTGPPAISPSLRALQLTIDHSTNVEEEVLRIQAEHPDDKNSISNKRVKGRLKVTRAFGAGFLKLPRWNDGLLEMFRVDYMGTTPYITCMPAVHHHALGPNDRFLVLSSDGLYQYLSNEEVVSQVEWFMETYPDGDPAQYLIEELLFRAAKKAGMDFHELLDIPQGDRRKYHDDVSVMVISLEGRIWRSFG